MNRVLYQLSYAAIFFSPVSQARVIIQMRGLFVNNFFQKNSHLPLCPLGHRGGLLQISRDIRHEAVYLILGGGPTGAEADGGVVLVHLFPDAVGIVFIKFFQNIPVQDQELARLQPWPWPAKAPQLPS